MQKPLVFCLTPVKNEAWILERFLNCASIWADRIIIADQGSTDGSREIAQRFSKVTLVDNRSQGFNEPERQQMLLAEARRTPGRKVLMALDADEFLTANFLTSPEWQSIITARPGTIISLQWPEIEANVSDLSFFYFPSELPVGFVDDGSEHQGKAIHSFRVPTPPSSPTLRPTEIKLMHYCLFDLDRFKSRIRWYQCYEYLTFNKRPIQLYRFYHLVLFVSRRVIQPVPKEWIKGYEDRGIDMSSITRDSSYHWDKEVLRYFDQYGTARFRQLSLWDVDWSKIYHDHYPLEDTKSFPDPRSWLDKRVHRWLKATQPEFSAYGTNPGIVTAFSNKCITKALGLLGW